MIIPRDLTRPRPQAADDQNDCITALSWQAYSPPAVWLRLGSHFSGTGA